MPGRSARAAPVFYACRLCLVPVRMMRVRHMRMRMRHRFVPVPMAVRAGGRCILRSLTHRFIHMRMGMVAIIVAVCVFVFERIVRMRMPVLLGQMQRHAGQHQQRARHQPD